MATVTRSIADERQQKSHIDHSKAPENPATCQFLPYKHHSPIAWAGTDQKQEKVEVIPKHRAIMNVGMGASAAHVGNSQSAAPLLSHTEDRLREIDQNPINDATQPRARPNQQSETLQTVDIGPEALPAVDMVWKLSNLDYMPRPIKVVRVGDEGFPREAQDKYQRFMDYRRQMCEIEPNVKSLFSKKVIRRVLLPSREGSAEPVPYILIKGCNKTEVTKLHTELSRRVWRREYHPPLKICYQLGSLLFPASQKEVFFAEDQERVTLCGALVSIADGKENRTVTLGGILESNRRLFAFTAGHSSSTASELEEEGSFTGQHTKEQDGNFEATVTIPQAQDYDDDIEDALVFLHAEELDNDVEDASVTPHAKAYKKSSSTTSTEWSKTPTIGHVDISGQDWSLVALNDPLLALPNIFNNVESGLTQCYLHEVAQQPGKCVVVLAGASGQKKMKMISGEAEICLPSGEWVVTWELEMDVNSPLRKGDSGSLVVDADTGVVYGHIIARDLDTAYIHPLIDVLVKIERHNQRGGRLNSSVSLPAAFDVLSSLSRAHSQQKRTGEASRFAKESISKAVLDTSGRSKTAIKIKEYLENSSEKAVIITALEQLIPIFGANISTSLSSWDEGDLGFLLIENFVNKDLRRQISKEIKTYIGIAFPHDVDTEVKDDNGQTPLSWSTRSGHETAVELILERDTKVDSTDDNGRTLLSWAAQNGDYAAVQRLYTEGAYIDAKDIWDRTPLSWAAGNGHQAVVQLLLMKGANFMANDTWGWTPLFWAAGKGHKDVVQLLVAKGANVEIKDDSRRTPLWWAAANGHRDIVQLLIKNRADVEAKDTSSRTSLSWAAVNGYKDIIQLLIKERANVETKDTCSRTPLSWAAGEGYKDVVQLLVEKGADVETKDISNRTPLSWAAGKGYKDIVQLLVKKGANVEAKDNSSRPPLWWAAANGHRDIVQLLIENRADVEAKDSLSRTSLLCAATNGHRDVVQLLIEEGADIETKDGSSRTPLSWAAANGYIDVVQLLADKGADIETMDEYGRRPLSWAVANGHTDVIRFLVESIANIETKGKGPEKTQHPWDELWRPATHVGSYLDTPRSKTTESFTRDVNPERRGEKRARGVGYEDTDP